MKIFKHTILITLLTPILLTAQKIDTNYLPEYSGNVSRDSYEYGMSILKASYEAYGLDDNKEEYWADYYNVGLAFSKMGVAKTIIFDFLLKAKSLNSKNFCTMIVSEIEGADGDITRLTFQKTLGDAFVNLISNCDFEIQPFTLKYLKEKKQEQNLAGLNESLINKLIVLQEMDLRYRYSSNLYHKNLEKQHLLDQKIGIELSKIFDEYGYPGKDMVGDYYQNLACLLLEHSGGKDIPINLEYKEKYFPYVLEAYKKGKLDRAYLCMLIDRIHMFKNEKQVFGSQAGIPFYDDIALKKIKKEYGL